MKATLSVIAIVSLVAASKDDVIEYSNGIFKALRYTDPDAKKITAKAINAEFTRTLDRHIGDGEGAINLVPDLLPEGEPQGEHHICASSLGIVFIDDGSIFCEMDLFQVDAFEVTEGEHEHCLTLSLRFAPSTDFPLIVDVPVFKMPSAGSDYSVMWSSPAGNLEEDEFRSWAAIKKIGILSPFDEQQLTDLRNDVVIAVDYNWLNDLLQMGLFERTIQLLSEDGVNETEKPINRFVSRPLVLSEHITKAFLDLTYPWNADDKCLELTLPSTAIRPR